jgi:hypothetical protein
MHGVRYNPWGGRNRKMETTRTPREHTRSLSKKIHKNVPEVNTYNSRKAGFEIGNILVQRQSYTNSSQDPTSNITTAKWVEVWLKWYSTCFAI